MRIIAGTLKGRKLELPAGVSTRPTKDRVREAVFSTLNSILDFDSTVVCDLYAGSGAYGLEALSRGARGAVFCEADKRLCSAIERLRINWRIEAPMQVLCGRVEGSYVSIREALERLGEGLRIIFIDPPYANHPGAAILPELFRAKILIEGSVVVMEHSSAEAQEEGSLEVAELPLVLVEQKSRKYGDTAVTLYRF